MKTKPAFPRRALEQQVDDPDRRASRFRRLSASKPGIGASPLMGYQLLLAARHCDGLVFCDGQANRRKPARHCRAAVPRQLQGTATFRSRSSSQQVERLQHNTIEDPHRHRAGDHRHIRRPSRASARSAGWPLKPRAHPQRALPEPRGEDGKGSPRRGGSIPRKDSDARRRGEGTGFVEVDQGRYRATARAIAGGQ